MKSVLIIGKNSYIGKSFAEYAMERFNIKIVSSRNEQWKTVDFSEYDCVLYCAGVAHATKKSKTKYEYYRVNCDLAVNVAEKAKAACVPRFIYLSSMSVYGKTDEMININTKTNPENTYGNSKLTAEKELRKLETDVFKICVIRPPMVYGYGCKGNFSRLVRLVKVIKAFPIIDNKRSMIYIDNLCEFFCYAIDFSLFGVYLPQNSSYVNTTTLVKLIARIYNRRVFMTDFLNPLIFLFARFVPPIDKLFGDLTYEHSDYEDIINVVDFEESVARSV